MTITEFLEARIAEDEAAARNYARERSGEVGEIRHESSSDRDDGLDAYLRGPGSPARVLAECVVKRSLIKYWGQYDALNGPSLLTIMAMVYRDHPDYQQEWSA